MSDPNETPRQRLLSLRGLLPFLRPVLPEAVLEPIRLHVDAKRSKWWTRNPK